MSFFPRAIKWKSEEGKDYPTLSEEQYNNLMGRNIMIRDAAKKLVSNYKRTLRPIINNTDFIHDGELSALRFSYEAVHHPLMPKEETVSSEDKGFLDFPNPTSKPKQKRQKKKKKRLENQIHLSTRMKKKRRQQLLRLLKKRVCTTRCAKGKNCR
ncbi:MAG: hypothetical protein H6925_02455 [Holosporaceae bacterium]|nr:MAG: hypothetical protein H6925_02455 [Holosporaceae bacterium]